ncbi:MAG: hypothetical protein PUB22_02345 [Clostridiales bacterium]|nr:hypothetical protein [Clostridiales bacterium]
MNLSNEEKLRQALLAAQQEELDRLPSSHGRITHVFSREFEDNMNQLFEKEKKRKKKNRRFTYSLVGTAAAVFLICIASRIPGILPNENSAKNCQMDGNLPADSGKFESAASIGEKSDDLQPNSYQIDQNTTMPGGIEPLSWEITDWYTAFEETTSLQITVYNNTENTIGLNLNTVSFQWIPDMPESLSETDTFMMADYPQLDENKFSDYVSLKVTDEYNNSFVYIRGGESSHILFSFSLTSDYEYRFQGWHLWRAAYHIAQEKDQKLVDCDYLTIPIIISNE